MIQSKGRKLENHILVEINHEILKSNQNLTFRFYYFYDLIRLSNKRSLVQNKKTESSRNRKQFEQ